MRIAALDLGSNSFHLLVVDARLDGSFIPVSTDKEMLRLGDIVARSGVVDQAAADNAVAVVRRFRAIADSQHCDELLAYATSALREARNGPQIVDRFKREAGVAVEVIDGLVEARLIFGAVRASVFMDNPPALCADLGGGSLELMVGDPSGLQFATSLKLGVGRLTAEHVRSDPPTLSERKRLSNRVKAELDPVIADVATFAPGMLIGSSGTLISIARMAAAMADGELPRAINQLTVSADAISSLTEALWMMPMAQRAKLPGGDTKRAELLPAGTVILEQLLRSIGAKSLTVSDWGLREGMVLSAIGDHDRSELAEDPRAIRRFSVLSLCRRSSWRQRHARQVAEIASALFVELGDLHGLNAEDQELLEFGALVHDIGEHVSRVDHDQHSAYLVEHGGLRGFDPDEIRILVVMGRYHVRGNPRPSFKPYGQLGDQERSRALALTALLRIADALDTTHASVVEKLEVGYRHGKVTIVVHAKGDAELELWALRRKQELFEKTFKVKLEVGLVSSAHDEYGDPSALAGGGGLG